MIDWLMRLFRHETVDHPIDAVAEKSAARDRADRAIEATMQLQAELDAMTRVTRQRQPR